MTLLSQLQKDIKRQEERSTRPIYYSSQTYGEFEQELPADDVIKYRDELRNNGHYYFDDTISDKVDCRLDITKSVLWDMESQKYNTLPKMKVRYWITNRGK